MTCDKVMKELAALRLGCEVNFLIELYEECLQENIGILQKVMHLPS